MAASGLSNITEVKGDAIDIEVTLNTDITGWEIRVEVWDNQDVPVFIRKANNNVTGGDSSQIEVTDALKGIFIIHIASGETTNMKGDVRIEVEVKNTAGQIRTIASNYLTLLEERINWTNVV